jgi:hypothetical protein
LSALQKLERESGESDIIVVDLYDVHSEVVEAFNRRISQRLRRLKVWTADEFTKLFSPYRDEHLAQTRQVHRTIRTGQRTGCECT